MSELGKLYMLPGTIGDGAPDQVIGKDNLEVLSKLRYLIVESQKHAIRFLVKSGLKDIIPKIEFGILNEHTRVNEIAFLLEPLLEGQDAGLLSDAGCPGVADPGADVVALAHQKSVEIIPLVGPNSIILSLMGSGLNGQQFSFQGYLPAKNPQRIRSIKDLEIRSRKGRETQIFIEAPYRNNQLLKDLLTILSPGTLLCIACDLTQKSQFLKTKAVKEWKKNIPDIHKRPTVFLFLAY